MILDTEMSAFVFRFSWSEFLGAFAQLQKSTISFVMYVCLSACLSIRKERPAGFSWSLPFEVFFKKNLSRKYKFHSNQGRIMGTVLVDLCTFMILSHWILLKLEEFQTKVVETIKTHILCSTTFFFLLKPGRLWDNLEKYGTARRGTGDNITRCMCSACWIPKATNTHSEYVILIAFQRHQWLREGASMLRYITYIACLVKFIVFWVLISCSFVHWYRRFGTRQYLHLQRWNNSEIGPQVDAGAKAASPSENASVNGLEHTVSKLQ